MTLYVHQGQYNALSEAESDVKRALQEWKDAGGPVCDVLRAINELIDLRVRLARENSRE